MIDIRIAQQDRFPRTTKPRMAWFEPTSATCCSNHADGTAERFVKRRIGWKYRERG